MIFNGLKMRNQILLFSILIIVIILLFPILIYLINSYWLEQLTLNLSLDTIRIENQRQLSVQMQLASTRIQTILKQIYRKQDILNNIYIYSYLKQPNMSSPFICPPNITLQDAISFFCLMATNYLSNNISEISSDIAFDMKFTALMHESLLMFDATQFTATGIAYTTNANQPILGTWPSLNATVGYNAHQRAWYLNHLKYMSTGQDHIFSDLFTTVFDSYTIAISSNLTLNGQYHGVIFDLLDFGNFKKKFPVNYILVNQQGQLILSLFPFKVNDTTPIYFYSQHNTGFNEDDWLEVQNFISDNETISNCQRQVDPNYLCRFNRQTQQDVLMIIQNMSQPPYIMIQFIQVSEIYNSIMDIQSQIHENFQLVMITNTIKLVLTASIMIVFISISIARFTRPLEFIIKYTKSKIDNKQCYRYNYLKVFKRIQEFDKSENKSTFQSLEFAYFCTYKIQLEFIEHLTDPQSRNQVCQEFNSIEYEPLNTKHIDYSLRWAEKIKWMLSSNAHIQFYEEIRYRDFTDF